MVFFYQVADPDTLLNQDVSDQQLQDICRLDNGINAQYRQPRKLAQQKGSGQGNYPGENTVEQEGDHGLSAGTQGEVQSVQKALYRKEYRGNDNKPLSVAAHFVCGVIEQGKSMSGFSPQKK